MPLRVLLVLLLAGLPAVADERCPSWQEIPYGRCVRDAATAAGIDPLLLAAVVRVESDFNPSCRSRAGAVGLMQLMPDEARKQGLRLLPFDERLDPERSLRAGAQLLRELIDRFQGDVRKALSAYNSGPGYTAVWGGVTPESHGYTSHVVREWNSLRLRFRRQGSQPRDVSRAILRAWESDGGRMRGASGQSQQPLAARILRIEVG